MLRKYAPLVIALAIFSSSWNVTFAQENKTNPVGTVHLMRPLVGLRSKSVRKELKLADEQEQKVQIILDKVDAANKAFIDADSDISRKLSKEERQARRDEVRKIRDAANEEVTAILTSEQLNRFSQIRLQIERDYALLSEEVLAELKLATVQTDALSAIQERYATKLGPLSGFEGTVTERLRKREKMAIKLRREAGEECMGVLTKEQREQFDKMCGPIFEVDESDFPWVFGRQ